ncbi:MAG: pyridoxal-phosphate dependent enzyme [Deltaproteobacteria bacterium]|nr:pyridoxal-phosphate dependent enzyme [Deltaproteobacteria bacterium]
MCNPNLLPEKLREMARLARTEDPLHPVNLFNINWKDDLGNVMALVVPSELTGVQTPIAVLTGMKFPTGAHKVGPAYAILIEKQVHGEVMPSRHKLVFPSTGNFGIGGAWVGPRMGYRSLVVLPEDMSRERFEMIRGYGGEIIATPGSESNVKEIYDKVRELEREPDHAILNQFAEFGNYRFHATVTASAVEELARNLGAQGVGDGKPSAFVSAMGSAGTIGAGDPLKERHGTLIVGLEPIQCPTLYNVGFGAHRIEGIGDKHVTWIHNVLNMDALMCIDDVDTVRGMALLQSGTEWLVRDLGIDEDQAQRLAGVFGPSGVCNLIGAVKTVKHFRLTSRDLVVTVATDGFDRYPSVLEWLEQTEGKQTRERAARRVEIFHRAGLDWIQEGRQARERWHNQKYFTWVEQQGRSLEALQRQQDPAFWREQRDRVPEIDRRIRELRPRPGP